MTLTGIAGNLPFCAAESLFLPQLIMAKLAMSATVVSFTLNITGADENVFTCLCCKLLLIIINYSKPLITLCF
jgi:hypothetical protein